MPWPGGVDYRSIDDPYPDCGGTAAAVRLVSWGARWASAIAVPHRPFEPALPAAGRTDHAGPPGGALPHQAARAAAVNVHASRFGISLLLALKSRWVRRAGGGGRAMRRTLGSACPIP